MFTFPSELSPKQVSNLIDFLSHRPNPDGKRQTRTQVKLALSQHMPVNNVTGKLEDGSGYPFDPEQVDRRKREIPRAFCTSAAKYVTNEFDKLGMYYIMKYVLGAKIDEKAYMLSVIAEEELGIRGETLGSIRKMANSINQSKPIFGEEDASGVRHAHYLVITMPNEDEINVAPMSISYDGDELSVPEFETRSYDSSGDVTGEVSGFMVEASVYIYTIGKDFGGANLRISKLLVHNRLKEQSDDPNRFDLFGLRLGGFSNKLRPNSHRVFAYQIRDQARMEEVTQKIKMSGSLRNYSSQGMSIAEGLNGDFNIRLSKAETICKFLTERAEINGQLDTPIVEAR